MIDHRVVRRPKGTSQHGLYATSLIQVGELVWTPTNDDEGEIQTLHLSEVQSLPPDQRAVFLNFCYQVGPDLFSGPTAMSEAERDDSHFMNHSCDPNVWYVGHGLVARRDIQPGEEITYDYGTDCSGRDWGFVCTCGSKNCRGTVRHDDWKLLQKEYEGHFIEGFQAPPDE